MNNKFLSTIKMFFLLLMICPVIAMGQTKNVISARGVFPMQSGPDMGGFHITEWPTSGAALNTREDIGAEHKLDWNKNVAIYLTDKTSGSYMVYQNSLSTV